MEVLLTLSTDELFNVLIKIENADVNRKFPWFSGGGSFFKVQSIFGILDMECAGAPLSVYYYSALASGSTWLKMLQSSSVSRGPDICQLP